MSATRTKQPQPDVMLPPTTRPCDRLWYLMTRDGVSNYKLAEALGSHENTVRGWSSGKNGMTAQSIIAIANYFGCTTDFLLGRTEDGA